MPGPSEKETRQTVRETLSRQPDRIARHPVKSPGDDAPTALAFTFRSTPWHMRIAGQPAFA